MRRCKALRQEEGWGSEALACPSLFWLGPLDSKQIGEEAEAQPDTMTELGTVLRANPKHRG